MLPQSTSTFMLPHLYLLSSSQKICKNFAGSHWLPDHSAAQRFHHCGGKNGEKRHFYFFFGGGGGGGGGGSPV